VDAFSVLLLVAGFLPAFFDPLAVDGVCEDEAVAGPGSAGTAGEGCAAAGDGGLEVATLGTTVPLPEEEYGEAGA
jgi:hypothetical protein